MGSHCVVDNGNGAGVEARDGDFSCSTMNNNNAGTYRVLGCGNGVGATVRTIYNVESVGLRSLSKADAMASKTSKTIKDDKAT